MMCPLSFENEPSILPPPSLKTEQRKTKRAEGGDLQHKVKQQQQQLFRDVEVCRQEFLGSTAGASGPGQCVLSCIVVAYYRVAHYARVAVKGRANILHLNVPFQPAAAAAEGSSHHLLLCDPVWREQDSSQQQQSSSFLFAAAPFSNISHPVDIVHSQSSLRRCKDGAGAAFSHEESAFPLLCCCRCHEECNKSGV